MLPHHGEGIFLLRVSNQIIPHLHSENLEELYNLNIDQPIDQNESLHKQVNFV